MQKHEKGDGVITLAANQMLKQGVDVGIAGMALGVLVFLIMTKKKLPSSSRKPESRDGHLSDESSSMCSNLESDRHLAREVWFELFLLLLFLFLLPFLLDVCDVPGWAGEKTIWSRSPRSPNSAGRKKENEALVRRRGSEESPS